MPSSRIFTNATLAFGLLAAATLTNGCDKPAGGETGSATPTSATTSTAAAAKAAPAPAAAPAEIDCEKVVEKIASLNPPDMRGEPEKKLWRSMCAPMTPVQKTCVLGAPAMADLKACMKK